MTRTSTFTAQKMSETVQVRQSSADYWARSSGHEKKVPREVEMVNLWEPNHLEMTNPVVYCTGRRQIADYP